MWTPRPMGLESQERSAAWKLMQAFAEARNQRKVTLRERCLTQASNAEDLNAANPFARRKWGTALWSEFSEHFNLSESQPFPEVALFWVTLVDIGCFTKHDAERINLTPMIRHLREGLNGYSYVGLMDPGYYVNIARGTNFAERRGVNWHLHLFAWGTNRKEIKSRFAGLNDSDDNYRPIIPRGNGGHGAYWKQVTEGTLARQFRYMLKSPRKSYRIGRTEVCDPEGRVDFKFVQSKSELRPGERVTLFHLSKKFSLDELTVAGGEGVDLRRRALRQLVRTSGSHHR